MQSGPFNASHDADMFDSEMFEWTQIPCSPELCSSPTKSQVFFYTYQITSITVHRAFIISSPSFSILPVTEICNDIAD